MDASPQPLDVFVVTAFGAAFENKALLHPQPDVFRTWAAALPRFRKLMQRLSSRGFAVDVKRRAGSDTFALAMDAEQQTGVVLQRVRVNARCSRREAAAANVDVDIVDDGDDVDEADL
jgi:hypothetical protein